MVRDVRGTYFLEAHTRCVRICFPHALRRLCVVTINHRQSSHLEYFSTSHANGRLVMRRALVLVDAYLIYSVSLLNHHATGQESCGQPSQLTALKGSRICSKGKTRFSAKSSRKSTSDVIVTVTLLPPVFCDFSVMSTTGIVHVR